MKEYLNRMMKTAGELARQVMTRAEGIGKRLSEDVKRLPETAGKLAERAGTRVESVRGRMAEMNWPAEAKKWASAAAARLTAAAKKPPEIKSVVLQTYLTSLLCLVLCVGMFLGTSYAWFTSEVSNNANEIYIGILDVELEKKNGDKWDSLSATSGGKNITSLFSGDIRWEPGYTSMETIRVTNTGDLAFKYVLNFTEGEVQAKDKDGNEIPKDQCQSLEDVAKYFDVWFYDHSKSSDTTVPDPASYAVMTAEGSGWEKAGTLDEILAGGTVLSNQLETRDSAAVAQNTASAERTYTIALHMNDAADASVMGHKITLNVKLVAYQAASEQDGFGDSGYDNANFVFSAEQLQAALDEAKGDTTIVLGNDITDDIVITQKKDVNIILDGNGRTFTGVLSVFGDARHDGQETLTIRNIRFVAAEGEGACIYSPDRTVNDRYSYSHNVTVENCTFTDPDGAVDCAAIRHGDGGDQNWTVKNCTVDSTIHSLLQVNNVKGKLTVSGCSVASKNGINLNSCTNVEVADCNFNVKGYAVRFGVKTGGNIDEAKTFLIKDSVLESACDGGDAVIMFRADAVRATLTLTNVTITGMNDIAGETAETTIIRN